MKKSELLIFGLAVFLLSCSLTSKTASDSMRIDDPVALKEKDLFQSGDFYIGGQPSEETLQWMAENGVTTVINTCTVRETEYHDNQAYDEAAFLENLGITYVNIPIGLSSESYTQKVNTLAQILDNHKGKAFIHCKTGIRAIILWTSYLIKFRGFTIDTAVDLGRKMAPNLEPSNTLLNKFLGTET